MWPFDSGDDDRQKQKERAARREARAAMDQYKKQQAEAEKGIEERKAEQAMEKRTIAEKQIRSLRASFRRPSIMSPAGAGQNPIAAPAMGTMQPAQPGMEK